MKANGKVIYNLIVKSVRSCYDHCDLVCHVIHGLFLTTMKLQMFFSFVIRNSSNQSDVEERKKIDFVHTLKIAFIFNNEV